MVDSSTPHINEDVITEDLNEDTTDSSIAKKDISLEKQVSKRLKRFGTTIFTEISALAMKHGAVNLGQGFPNFDGPTFVIDASIQAMREEKNQYARMSGTPELNKAIADRFEKDTGIKVHPDNEITVTAGCTEAIAASILGLVNPGDEVILFQPFYDSYLSTLSMAGAVAKVVTLRPPNFELPKAALQAAFSEKTKAILVNSPHNPTGKVFSKEELNFIAELCQKYNSICLSDEVYNRMVYASEYTSMAQIPGMFERTITMNSLGKTYSLTGWKIGWAIAPQDLTWGIRLAHSYLTFSIATPLQLGAVAALNAPDSFYDELIESYSNRRSILIEGLKDVGFTVYEPQGSYFIMADHRIFGFDSDVQFCRHLIENVGVAAIPPSAFYVNSDEGKNMVRFAFCKDEETLREAVRRMKQKLKPKI